MDLPKDYNYCNYVNRYLQIRKPGLSFYYPLGGGDTNRAKQSLVMEIKLRGGCMKRFLFIVIAISMMVMPCFAGGEKTVVMKFAHEMPIDSTRHQALLQFQKYVEESSAGNIKVELYPAGQLGKDAELVELLKLGSIEGYIGGAFDSMTPKINLFGMPFLFPDRDSFLKVTKNKDLLKIINTASEKNGIKILSVGDGGSRNISNNVRPIKSPADLKGLKMRTPPMENVIKCMEALGANPVTIPYGDTYMALKTGVADGQENPNMNMAVMKFYEVQKYLTIINYVWNPEPVCVCKAWFDKLDPKYQKIIQDGADLYTNIQNDLRAKTDAGYIDTMKKAGMQIYTLSSAEQKPFMDKCTSVYQYFVDKGLFSKEELDFVKMLANQSN